MEQENQLLLTQEGYIKHITLYNPKRKNALTRHMMEGIVRAIEQSQTDSTRVIVLKGADRNFSSGADLIAGEELLANAKQYMQDVINPMIMAIRHTNIPVLAAVSGVCVGLGCSLALACDMILASKDARFSQIFTNIGLSADGGSSYFLPRLVGYQKAFEWMALASIISAEEAFEYKLINRLYDTSEQLEEGVQQLARQLAEGPFIAIQHTKANLRSGLHDTLEQVLHTETENQAKNFRTQDFMEGVQAFLQKRKPNYQGK